MAVRITKTAKYFDLPTVTAVSEGEMLHGCVRCDSLNVLYEDEPSRELGRVTRVTMRAVEDGLKYALGMS